MLKWLKKLRKLIELIFKKTYSMIENIFYLHFAKQYRAINSVLFTKIFKKSVKSKY